MPTPKVVIDTHLQETLTRTGGRVALDATLRAQLLQFRGQVELCDETGQTVGFFVPARQSDQCAAYAWLRTQVSDDELEKARQEPGGISTADLLQRLERL
jgi:hypothetical protein